MIAVLALASVPSARAQRPIGRLEGTVTDSARGGPLRAATVLVTRSGPEPAWFSAVTDDRGRYRLDTIPAGRYGVTFWHATLDSIEVELPVRSVDVVEGRRTVADLALPPGAALRAMACPSVTLPPGTGVLSGQVDDADGDRPLAGAVVAVRWSDFTLDRATLQVSTGERTVGARTDAGGKFRFCGVPTDEWLAVQVQHEGRVASVVRATVPDTLGVAVLDLSFSVEASRVVAAGDSVAREDTTTPPPLTGTAAVSGTVVGETGQPLSGVQLRVLQTAATTRTDSAGRFAMSGLPAGTQLLEAKRLGYRIVQQNVALRRGRTVEVLVRLARVVSLDSIRVVAQRARYREFERNRRNGFGRYLTEDDVAKRNPMQVSDLLWGMPGMRVVGFGYDARVVSSRGTVFSGACGVNVVIDGMQHQDINWLHPADVGAMEVYPGPAGAPIQYDNRCGVIVIWTRR